MHFFPLSLVHMRAQLCLCVSHFQFVLSNGNKTFECECVKYVYSLCRAYVCVFFFINLSVSSVYRVRCVVYMCTCSSCTRVNIRVLKDNDFSGITFLIKQLIALYLSLTMVFF